MNIIDNTTTYLLPLDAIDLNTIATRIRFPNDTVPLWSGSKHASGEYYEVEIMAEKKLKSNHDTGNGTVINDPSFHCQVCDISVPLGYKKQHNLSIKHKTCLKILEIATDRTKNLLLATDEDSVEPAPDSYYCEACAIAVMTFKRKEHDLSEEHLKSLQYDRLLNDLLRIYVEKKQLDNIDFEYLTNGNKKYNEHKNDSHNNVVDCISEFDVIHSEDDDSVNLKEYLEKVDKDVKIRRRHRQRYRRRATEGSLFWHCDLCKTSIFNIDEHKTKTEGHINILRNEISQKNVVPNNYTPLENVVQNNEQSTSAAPKPNKTYCLSCNVYIDTHNFAEHTESRKHKQKVRAPMQTPNSGIDTDKKTFCAPCNIYLDTNNLSSHLNGQRHKANISSLGKESDGGSTTSDRKELKTFCTTCNLHINTNQYQSHIGGKNHKSKLFTLKDIEEYVYSTTETGKVCRICNVSVPPTEKNLSEHCQGNNHANNFDTLLSKYKIRKLNNKLICGKCDQQFDVHSFLDHIKTHDVKEVPSKFRRCRICNIWTTGTLKAIDLHKHGDIHKNNLKEFEHPHLNPISNNGDVVKCRVCDVEMDVLESKVHVTSDSHLLKFKLLVRENKALIRNGLFICTLCSFVIKDEAEFLCHIISDALHREYRDSIDDHRFIKCIFCDVQVLHSEKNLEIHENGNVHKNCFEVYFSLLDFNNCKYNHVVRVSNKACVRHFNHSH